MGQPVVYLRSTAGGKLFCSPNYRRYAQRWATGKAIDAYNVHDVIILADGAGFGRSVVAHEPVHSIYAPGRKVLPATIQKALDEFPDDLRRFNLLLTPDAEKVAEDAVGDAMNRWVNNDILLFDRVDAERSAVVVSIVEEVANNIFSRTDRLGKRTLHLYRSPELTKKAIGSSMCPCQGPSFELCGGAVGLAIALSEGDSFRSDGYGSLDR